LLPRPSSEELLRSVEHLAGLLDGRMSLLNLPIQCIGRPMHLLDKIASARNGVRRFT